MNPVQTPELTPPLPQPERLSPVPSQENHLEGILNTQQAVSSSNKPMETALVQKTAEATFAGIDIQKDLKEIEDINGTLDNLLEKQTANNGEESKPHTDTVVIGKGKIDIQFDDDRPPIITQLPPGEKSINGFYEHLNKLTEQLAENGTLVAYSGGFYDQDPQPSEPAIDECIFTSPQSWGSFRLAWDGTTVTLHSIENSNTDTTLEGKFTATRLFEESEQVAHTIAQSYGSEAKTIIPEEIKEKVVAEVQRLQTEQEERQNTQKKKMDRYQNPEKYSPVLYDRLQHLLQENGRLKNFQLDSSTFQNIEVNYSEESRQHAIQDITQYIRESDIDPNDPNFLNYCTDFFSNAQVLHNEHIIKGERPTNTDLSRKIVGRVSTPGDMVSTFHIPQEIMQMSCVIANPKDEFVQTNGTGWSGGRCYVLPLEQEASRLLMFQGDIDHPDSGKNFDKEYYRHTFKTAPDATIVAAFRGWLNHTSKFRSQTPYDEVRIYRNVDLDHDAIESFVTKNVSQDPNPRGFIDLDQKIAA